MTINRVSIVGMGALGILFGGFLTEKLGKNNVEFITNKDRMEKYKLQGLYSNGKACDFNLVDEDDEGSPADLLIFAVKATSLDEAIKSAKNKVSEDTIIISLLNGISSEEILGNAFGKEKLLYAVAEEMDAVKINNQFTYKNMGYLCIGSISDEETMKNKLDELIALFDKINFPYKLENNVLHRLWSKFMLNVGVNQVVMIYEGNYGTIHRPGQAREMMIAAMREVISLAKYENINVTEDDLNFYVALIDTLNPDGMPSMRQDGLAKRKSEVEIFSGKVIALGQKYNICTPINKEIYERVKQLESKY